VFVQTARDLLHVSDGKGGPSVLRHRGSGLLLIFLLLLLHSAEHFELSDGNVVGGNLEALGLGLDCNQDGVLPINADRASDLHDRLLAVHVGGGGAYTREVLRHREDRACGDVVGGEESGSMFLHVALTSLRGILLAQGRVDGSGDLAEGEGEGLGQRGSLGYVCGLFCEDLRQGGGELVDSEGRSAGQGPSSCTKVAGSCVFVQAARDLFHVSNREGAPSVLTMGKANRSRGQQGCESLSDHPVCSIRDFETLFRDCNTLLKQQCVLLYARVAFEGEDFLALIGW